MQTNFEKKIREKMHDFRLEPSNHVWKDISTSLDAPEKRRVIAWWMFAACFAVAGIIAAGIWMTGNHSVLPAKNNIADKTNTIANHQPAPLSANLNLSADHSHNSNSNNVPEANYSIRKNSVISNAGEITDQKEIAETKNDPAAGNNSGTSQDQNNFAEESAEKNKNEQENILSSSNSSSSENNVSDKTSSSTKNNSDILSSKNNSTFFNSDENKNHATKIAATDQQKNNTASQKKSTSTVKPAKRSHWSLLFGGGSTNTVNENFLFVKSKPLIYHNNSGASDTVKSMRPAYPGFHVTGGVQYSFALNRHWTLYSGLQYSFLLNHQRTGKQVSQASEISNTADTFATASQHYFQILSHYADGTSQLNTNYASWLEMPVSFGYKINPRSKVNVELRGGVSVTHMFGDKWLIPDGRYNKFYYSNELTNNYIVNAHEDVVLTLPKNKIIGLQFQHSITSLGKSPVQPALYWSNISVYTTIPLK